MVRLIAFLKPHRRLALSAFGLSFLALGSQIGLIGTSAYLISRAALRPQTILLLMVPIVGVQFFSILRSASRYLERLLAHDVTFRLLGDLRVWFFGRIEAMPPQEVGRFHGGDILSRAVHDIDSLQDFYLRALAPPAVLLLTALLVWLVLRGMSAPVAWLVAGALLLSALPALLQLRLASRLGGEELRARADLSAAIADGVQGVAELLAYGRVESYQADLQAVGRRLTRAQRGMRRAGALALALIGLLGNLAMIFALVLAIPEVRSGGLPGWDLAVLALIALAAFEAAGPLPQSFQAIARCLGAGRRIFELADGVEPPLPAARREPADASIDLRGLSVRFAGAARPALQDIHLSLPLGRHVAVVGPSGAGKSTLIACLTGFVRASEGSLLLGGVPIEQIGPDDVRRLSAVIAQDTWLFNATLGENIRLGSPDATDDEVTDAAEAAQLLPLLAMLPEGLATVVGERGARLSGGERQRVAIARALLKDAPILLLDEPTEGLDAPTEEGVMGQILRLAEGRTLLMATHRLGGLEAMDEIIVLAAGCIVERGTHRELLGRQGLYAHLWALQADLLQTG